MREPPARQHAVMRRGQYNPPRGSGAGPCWHCQFFDGLAYEGVHAFCGRPGTSRVTASPAFGCVYFVRVPGVDDEPGPPAGFTGDDGTGAWRDLITGRAARDLFTPGPHPLCE